MKSIIVITLLLIVTGILWYFALTAPKLSYTESCKGTLLSDGMSSAADCKWHKTFQTKVCTTDVYSDGEFKESTNKRITTETYDIWNGCNTNEQK